MGTRMTFFVSFYDAIMRISDPAERLTAFEAVCSYGFTGQRPENVGATVDMILDLVCPVIDKSSRSRDNGARGGRPKKPTLLQSDNLPFSKTDARPLSDEKAEKEKEKEEEKEKEQGEGDNTRSQINTPPTLEEVRAYCIERGSKVDPEKFYDHYQSNGWLVGGKTLMTDWRASFRNWERREHEPTRSVINKQPSHPQRKYDFEALERALIKN